MLINLYSSQEMFIPSFENLFVHRREERLTITKTGADVIKANVVVTFIASIWVVLRLISRRMRKVGLHLEDYMIIGALVRITLFRRGTRRLTHSQFFLYASLASMILGLSYDLLWYLNFLTALKLLLMVGMVTM